MTDQSFLEQRLDASTWPIAVGDLVVLLALLLVGTARHSSLGPLELLQSEPLVFVNAAAPFLVGWLIAAPLVGAYSPGGGSAPNSSIPLAIRSWVPAVVVGFLIRVTPLIDGGFDRVFALVLLVGGAVVLSVWRFLYFQLR